MKNIIVCDVIPFSMIKYERVREALVNFYQASRRDTLEDRIYQDEYNPVLFIRYAFWYHTLVATRFS
jgi:hypothetical protein